MKNIWQLFNIHLSTYILILSFLFTGLIKNIMLIYLIVIVHELGHIFIIKVLGYNVISVDIYPSGGITKIAKPINTKISHDLVIAVFGVLFQVLLYLLFYLLYSFSYIRSSTYELFVSYNTTILIFNALPIVPLDGYQFLRGISEIFWPFKQAFKISFIISLVSGLMFLTYHQLFSLNNYLIVSFLIYKLFLEFKNFKYQHERFLLERYLYDFPYRTIKNEKEINLDRLKKDTYHYFLSNRKYLSEKKVLEKKYLPPYFKIMKKSVGNNLTNT